jgi:hypothetical protein
VAACLLGPGVARALQMPGTAPGWTVCSFSHSGLGTRRGLPLRPARRSHCHAPAHMQLEASNGLELALNSKDAAAGLGYLIGAGAVLLYTPMIYRVSTRKSGSCFSKVPLSGEIVNIVEH